MRRVTVVAPRRETGTADRPTGSRQVIQIPYDWWLGPEQIGYVEAPDPPRYSDTQGIGKSPGMRWPWQRFGVGKSQSVYRNYRPHWNHQLPSRTLIAGERGPLNANYLHYYEQAPRHAWPGGGVIEYEPTLPVTSVARRLKEALHG